MIHCWHRDVGALAKIAHSGDLGLGFEARHETSSDSGHQFAPISKSDEVTLHKKVRTESNCNLKKLRDMPCEKYLERVRHKVNRMDQKYLVDVNAPAPRNCILTTSAPIFSRTMSLSSFLSTWNGPATCLVSSDFASFFLSSCSIAQSQTKGFFSAGSKTA